MEREKRGGGELLEEGTEQGKIKLTRMFLFP